MFAAKKQRLLAAEAELRAATEDLLKGSFVVNVLCDFGTKCPEHKSVARLSEPDNGYMGCDNVTFISESQEALEEYYKLFVESNPGIEKSISWEVYSYE